LAKQKRRRAAGRLPLSAGVPKRAVVFAPWRIEFVQGPREEGCFLCAAAALPDEQSAWRKALLLHRDPQVLVMMNRYPYTGGHLLVAPLRHTGELSGLSEAESQALWAQARRCLPVLEQVCRAQGFNLGLNLGRAAGAGIADHLHLHVVPRWVGDTNFLPVLGRTHTVPVALEALWEELRPKFSRV
jgi:ATP adenylyltransferase